MSIVERAIKKLQESHERDTTRLAAVAHAMPAAAEDPGVARPAVDISLTRDAARRVRFDLDRLRVHRLMPSVEQERELASQYRHIKRPLIARGLGRGHVRVPRGNAVIVVSALPNEGKTFTALNLALSMALEQDIRVLLVDADVGKPRLTQEFGLEGETGLLDALRDDTLDMESMVVGTDVPGLSLLPTGALSGTSTELLASPRMNAVIDQLCGRYDNRMIVFDSPPMLPTTEARVLAQAMGQVLLVVRASSTPQQAVYESLNLIGQRDNVNLVLTHAHVETAGSYYYGGYGYGSYGAAGD